MLGRQRFLQWIPQKMQWSRDSWSGPIRNPSPRWGFGQKVDPNGNVSRRDIIDLVAQLERLSIKGVNVSTLDLTCHLRQFHGFFASWGIISCKTEVLLKSIFKQHSVNLSWQMTGNHWEQKSAKVNRTELCWGEQGVRSTRTKGKLLVMTTYGDAQSSVTPWPRDVTLHRLIRHKCWDSAISQWLHRFPPFFLWIII